MIWVEVVGDVVAYVDGSSERHVDHADARVGVARLGLPDVKVYRRFDGAAHRLEVVTDTTHILEVE